MPLTPFQRRVARVLAANRSPDSHIAGGAAINRRENSPRFSDDLDIFHDLAASVTSSAERDAEGLQAAGLKTEWTHRSPGFVRALVSSGEDHVRLDWTTDSAFRFFPVQPDEEFGFCLHPADLATNKVLALAGRTEVRDFLDTLFLDSSYLSLGALIWAACGKDQGYTPALLLEQTDRHSRFQQADLASESLARPVDLKELKRQWLAARERAEGLFAALPPAELGCLYLGPDEQAVTPDPNSPEFPGLVRRFGSVRGAWPTIS